MDNLIHSLEKRFPKSDKVAQGTHENKYSMHVEQTSINKYMLRIFNSNIGDNHGWAPEGILFHKTNMRSFNGINPITRIY